MKGKKKPDPYQALGVEKDATPDDIKRAHRKRIRKAHPDSGGNPEEFMALQCAYETLTDPEKRRRYDNDEPEPGNIVQEAFGHLCRLFQSLLDERGDAITTIDIVAALLGRVTEDIQKIKALKNHNTKKAKTLAKLRDRLTYKGKRVDVLGELLDRQLRDLEQGAKGADRTIEMLEMVTILAKEYTFERESPMTSDFAATVFLQRAHGNSGFRW